MDEIGPSASCFAGRVAGLFPNVELAGLTIKRYELPSGPAVTLAYIGDLLSLTDLLNLILKPLAGGIPDMSPAELEATAVFPAPFLQTTTDWCNMSKHLLAGRIALHVDGYPGALLLGSGEGIRSGDSFDADLDHNRALLRRYVADSYLQSAGGTGDKGVRAYVLYLSDRASDKTVQQVAQWAKGQSLHLKPIGAWRRLIELVQLPMTVECPSPAQAALFLRCGYIALLVDQLPGAQMAPLTLELLLSGPQDAHITPGVRRMVVVPRLMAVVVALLMGALLVAVTSYHHAVLSGPLLVVLSAGGSNLPMPVSFEVLLVGFLDDAMAGAAVHLAGRQWAFLAVLGTILTDLTVLHSGFISPMTAIVGIFSSVALHMVPIPTTSSRLRIWRVFFVLAGAGLGMFGIALLLYLMMIYLAEAQRFGHRIREKPEGACP